MKTLKNTSYVASILFLLLTIVFISGCKVTSTLPSTCCEPTTCAKDSIPVIPGSHTCAGTMCNQDSLDMALENVEIVEECTYGLYFHIDREINTTKILEEINYRYRNSKINFVYAGVSLFATSDNITTLLESGEQNYDTYNFVRRVDGNRVINLYFLEQSGDGLLGWVMMPQTDFESIAIDDLYWKAFIAYSSFSEEWRDETYTCVHEINHLFGLPHEFDFPINVQSYSDEGHYIFERQIERAEKFTIFRK